MEFQFTTPREYARELAKAIGQYATLGMAEDTNTLNDGVLSDDAFIALCDGFISADTSLLILQQSLKRRRKMAIGRSVQKFQVPTGKGSWLRQQKKI